VLISAQLRAHEHNRTKFYRIDYRALDAMLPDQVGSMRPEDEPSNAPDQADSSYTETSSKTPQKKGKRPTRAQKSSNPYRPDEYADVIL
jgi:hypothetical protein